MANSIYCLHVFVQFIRSDGVLADRENDRDFRLLFGNLCRRRLTMISAIMLIFIDEDETDRVLEGRLGDDDEDEDEWWTDGENQWRVRAASMQQWRFM